MNQSKKFKWVKRPKYQSFAGVGPVFTVDGQNQAVLALFWVLGGQNGKLTVGMQTRRSVVLDEPSAPRLPFFPYDCWVLRAKTRFGPKND